MAKPKHENIEDKKDPVKQIGDGKSAPRFLGLVKLPTTKRDRWLTAGVAVLLFLVVLVATPYSRYGISGQIIKKTVKVDVSDSRTGKPVSDVVVTIGPVTAKTNAEGEATLAKVPVGDWMLSAGKKYYTPFVEHLNVPLLTSPTTDKFRLVALGNPVTIKMVNKITNKPVSKASLTALGATTTTDSSGQATLVLPIQQTTVQGVINTQGYNSTGVTIQNTNSASDTFAITPSGKIFYLSNATGNINVMESNLDGSSQRVLVAGTGNEDNANTQLLSTTDWSYLALFATRDPNTTSPSLYLINTSTGQLSLMDQGKVSFNIIGWYDHIFVYEVLRDNGGGSQTGVLKSFNADNGSLRTLYQTNGSNQYIDNYAFFGDSLVFDVDYDQYGLAPGQAQATLEKVDPSNGNSSVLKSEDAASYDFSSLTSVQPNKLDYGIYQPDGTALGFYQMTAGSGTTQITSIPNSNSSNPPETYLTSPSEDKTLWYVLRDGKNTLFTGDENGENPVQIAALSDYTPFGWYSDNYILITKNHSELYIAPADMSTAPIKVSDYYSSGQYVRNGYGGGYGGQ